MVQLYTASWRQAVIKAKRYDEKGHLICEQDEGTQITMTALPYNLAMRYKNLNTKDFKITPYEPHRARPGKASKSHVGETTSKAKRTHVPVEVEDDDDMISHAAEAGDMSKAVSI